MRNYIQCVSSAFSVTATLVFSPFCGPLLFYLAIVYDVPTIRPCPRNHGCTKNSVHFIPLYFFVLLVKV